MGRVHKVWLLRAEVWRRLGGEPGAGVWEVV